MKTLKQIKTALARLGAEREQMLDRMQEVADLALPFHPWQKRLGKFIRLPGDPFLGDRLWRVVSLECASGFRDGRLYFLVNLLEHSAKLRRPLKRKQRLNIYHLEACEVVP